MSSRRACFAPICGVPHDQRRPKMDFVVRSRLLRNLRRSLSFSGRAEKDADSHADMPRQDARKGRNRMGFMMSGLVYWRLISQSATARNASTDADAMTTGRFSRRVVISSIRAPLFEESGSRTCTGFRCKTRTYRPSIRSRRTSRAGWPFDCLGGMELEFRSSCLLVWVCWSEESFRNFDLDALKRFANTVHQVRAVGFIIHFAAQRISRVDEFVCR
jgi:hypothetical protein